MGGVPHYQTLNAVDMFDFATNVWIFLPPLQKARSLCAAVAVFSCVYAIGGQDTVHRDLASIEKYTLHSGQWELVAPLTRPSRAL